MTHTWGVICMAEGRVFRPKTFLGISKLSIMAPCPTAKGKYSQLTYDIYKGSPRIVVKTNDPGDTRNYGRIVAAFSPADFYYYLEVLEKHLLDTTVDTKTKVECYNHSFEGGKRSQDITLQNDVWVGRDKEGLLFISLIDKTAEDRPVIKFVFDLPDTRYHKCYHGDGSMYTKPERGNLVARVHLSALRGILPHLMLASFNADNAAQDDKPAQNWSNNKPAAQKPASDTDDDLPF